MRSATIFAMRVDPRADPLGQIEVVLVQGVLGVIAAADHAPAAEIAPRTCRALSAEVGVWNRHVRLAEEHRHCCRPEAVSPPCIPCKLLERAVSGFKAGIGRRTQCFERGLVVSFELMLPIRETCPTPGAEELFRRDLQGVCVYQGTSAHPDAGEHREVPEQGDAEEPEETEHRHPEPFSEVPVPCREVLLCQPFPFFEHQDPVTLFGQAKGGDGTAETGAYDKVVVIICSFFGSHRCRYSITGLSSLQSGNQ